MIPGRSRRTAHRWVLEPPRRPGFVRGPSRVDPTPAGQSSRFGHTGNTIVQPQSGPDEVDTELSACGISFARDKGIIQAYCRTAIPGCRRNANEDRSTSARRLSRRRTCRAGLSASCGRPFRAANASRMRAERMFVPESFPVCGGVGSCSPFPGDSPCHWSQWHTFAGSLVEGECVPVPADRDPTRAEGDGTSCS